MKQALGNIKVIDFTQLLQGPFATQMLGDFGADIIKIEKIDTGDIYRQMTFFNEWIGEGESPCFLAWNRNKRSLAINLKSEKGKEIICKLIAKADIVVENFRPGVMEKLGFGYDAFKKINPRIIYCSASGWGKDGPYIKRPGQDLLAQGLSGLAMASGCNDGGPVPIGTGLCDQLGAFHVVYGVLMALYHREITGIGQNIQVNLLASAIAIQMQDFMTILNMGRNFIRPNSGIGHAGSGAPFGTYATKDGYLSIAMNPWPTIVEALDVPELIRFNDPQVLFDRRDEIWGEIQKITLTKTTAEWLDIMLGLDLWVAEITPQSKVPDDTQVKHLNLFTTVDHPKAGLIHTVNIPIELSETPGSIQRPMPLVGQHSREILVELGYLETDIEEFLIDKVISIEKIDNV